MFMVMLLTCFIFRVLSVFIGRHTQHGVVASAGYTFMMSLVGYKTALLLTFLPLGIVNALFRCFLSIQSFAEWSLIRDIFT